MPEPATLFGLLGRERLQLRVRGAVQGVGFRPFVHRLAAQHELSGFVLNDGDGVLLEVEGDTLDAFVERLEREPPPLARIDGVEITSLPSQGTSGFEIRESGGGTTRTRIVPDAATCHASRQPGFLARPRVGDVIKSGARHV